MCIILFILCIIYVKNYFDIKTFFFRENIWTLLIFGKRKLCKVISNTFALFIRSWIFFDAAVSFSSFVCLLIPSHLQHYPLFRICRSVGLVYLSPRWLCDGWKNGFPSFACQILIGFLFISKWIFIEPFIGWFFSSDFWLCVANLFFTSIMELLF